MYFALTFLQIESVHFDKYPSFLLKVTYNKNVSADCSDILLFFSYVFCISFNIVSISSSKNKKYKLNRNSLLFTVSEFNSMYEHFGVLLQNIFFNFPAFSVGELK